MSFSRAIALIFPGLLAVGAQFGTCVVLGVNQITPFVCYLFVVGCSGVFADFSIFKGVER